jgi:hypothetical protein
MKDILNHILREFFLLCLLDYSAGRIARELWWKNQEFYPAGIIPLLFSMLIYHLSDEH